MSTKLLAVGNVLMKDDGIAIYLAAELENRLEELGIEVIYVETDISYGISRIHDGDRVIIMDGARQGKAAGEVSLYDMEKADRDRGDTDGHNISVINLIKLFYPGCRCFILTIEVYEVDFHYGPSIVLKNRMPLIVQELIMKIDMALGA
jgi:hydrogenase maturation protease